MPIKRKKPFVIPEIKEPEKVYEYSYINGIEVDASRPDQPVIATVSVSPFNGREILSSQLRRVIAVDIFALAELDKDIANAAGALVVAAGKINDIAEEIGVDRVDIEVLKKYVTQKESDQ